MKTNCFPHTTLHAVAGGRTPHRFRDGETHFGSVLLIRLGEKKRCKKGAGPPRALVINLTEIAAAEDPGALWESESGPGDANG
jgi:hypothetical protein